MEVLLGDVLTWMDTGTIQEEPFDLTLCTSFLAASISDPFQRHQEFPSGLSSKFGPGPVLLNFRVNLRTGESGTDGSSLTS